MIGIGLIAVSAAGCEGDLATTLGVGEDQNLLTPAPDRPRRKPKVTPPPPKPKPAVVGPDPRKAILRKNFAFDSLRSKGITEVYDGKPTTAVGTFKKAQTIKPQDKSVQMWMDAIKKAGEQPRQTAPTGGHDFRSISNTIRNPGGGQAFSPNFQGAPAFAPPAVAPAPGAPGPAPSPLDPRQVF